MIAICRLVKEDLPKLAVLYEELMDEPTDMAMMSATFDWMATNPAYIVLVARLDGVVVGSLMGIVCRELLGQGKPFMVVENVIVASNCRRLGVGRRLMEEIERLAVELDCSLIQFCSSMHRKEAHLFYESMGYGPDVARGFRKWLK